MPTRYLKPGIRDSERVEAVLDPDAEILFYRLLIVVDDFGRTDARPLMVKSACFPIRMRVNADNCMQWLKILDSARLIGLYEVDGKPYLQIAKWDNKPRAQASKFPEPSADVYKRMQMLPETETETETVNREPKPVAPQALLAALGVPEQIAKDWLKVRKAKRAPLTQTALDDLQVEANKAGISIVEAITICARKNWQGFNSTWNWNDNPNHGKSQSVQEARLDVARQIFGDQNGTHRPTRDITPGRTIEGDGTIIPETHLSIRKPDAG